MSRLRINSFESGPSGRLNLSHLKIAKAETIATFLESQQAYFENRVKDLPTKKELEQTKSMEEVKRSGSSLRDSYRFDTSHKLTRQDRRKVVRVSRPFHDV